MARFVDLHVEASCAFSEKRKKKKDTNNAAELPTVCNSRRTDHQASTRQKTQDSQCIEKRAVTERDIESLITRGSSSISSWDILDSKPECASIH